MAGSVLLLRTCMLVYGDPFFEENLGEEVHRLSNRAAGILRSNGSPGLDELRALLIHVGQLEQAVQDANVPISADSLRSLVAHIATATDHAATAFTMKWQMAGGHLPTPLNNAPSPCMLHAVQAMRSELDALWMAHEVHCRIKVPEGFAFYALYPEQYCAAAARWLVEHATASPRRAVVVGVRSIGTTLSAVVAAMLRAHGWHVHRLTVRPHGHPYARQANLPSDALRGACYGIVVDEGPGLSGSSMAAAGAALQAAGLEHPHISFLPSHAGEVGVAASEEVRRWWSRTPRYVVPLQDLHWSGRSLKQALEEMTPALLHTRNRVESIEDMSGGLWRKIVYTDPNNWPAVCAPFERLKYRCRMQGGQAVLWKFAGLTGAPIDGRVGADAAMAQLIARSRRGWTPAPLGVAYGFLATPWIAGTPLRQADADAAVLSHIGEYLVDAAAPPLCKLEQQTARARLREMLHCNTLEGIGQAAAARANEWSDVAAGQETSAPHPTYGDGRMAPHEWLRTASGRLIKVDCWGHDADHTLIGRQSLAWDLAGTLVEWDLNGDSDWPLLAAMQRAGGWLPSSIELMFHHLAYAAFRMGQCAICAAMGASDPHEQAHLCRARDAYRSQLTRLLSHRP